MMTSADHEGQIFLSHPHMYNGFFFLVHHEVQHFIRDENSQSFSIRKICRLTLKWRKAIFKSLIKDLKSQISIETSQFMLNLYLELNLTSFKSKFQQKQLALNKSYVSAQSGNPDQS